MKERHWFTIAEAANYFSMKSKTLYSLAARRRLPDGAVLRLGRQVRLDVKKIEEEGVKNNTNQKRS